METPIDITKESVIAALSKIPSKVLQAELERRDEVGGYYSLYTHGKCGHRVSHDARIATMDGNIWIEEAHEGCTLPDYMIDWGVFFRVDPTGELIADIHVREPSSLRPIFDHRPFKQTLMNAPIYQAIKKAQKDAGKAK